MEATVHSPIEYRNYFNGHFNKFFKGSLRNTGSSVQWNINHLHDKYLFGGKNWRTKNPSIRRGPYGGVTHTHAYYLWQLHFHWGEPGTQDKGSEHTVDGAMYPLEMHMVHVEDNFIKLCELNSFRWSANANLTSFSVGFRQLAFFASK